MRAIGLAVSLVLASPLLLGACDRGANVLLLDLHAARVENNRVRVDVDLGAVEQGGGGVGPYCVTVHFLGPGWNAATPAQFHYDGELDYLEQCENDLGDGDERTLRFLSNRTDLPALAACRAQVRYAGTFRTADVVAP